MLTIKQIRDDKEAAARKLAKKGVDAAPVIEKIISFDDRRKALQLELDNTLAAQNKAAKEIGALMGQGRREEAEERKRFVADLKEKSSRLEAELTDARQELQSAIVSLPNFPAEIVPEGKTAEDNLVVKLVESYTALPENPLPHWELARKYDIIDFDLGVKLTGAGFPVYKGKGARLQRALINYFLDCNTAAGYLEVEPPVMVNEASGFGTGQLPLRLRRKDHRRGHVPYPHIRRRAADRRDLYRPARPHRDGDVPLRLRRLWRDAHAAPRRATAAAARP